jgi:hypothetical protein
MGDIDSFFIGNATASLFQEIEENEIDDLSTFLDF